MPKERQMKRMPFPTIAALAAALVTIVASAEAQGSGTDQRGFVTVTVALAPSANTIVRPEIRRPEAGNGKDVILIPAVGTSAQELARILLGYAASLRVPATNPTPNGAVRVRPALNAPAITLSPGQTAHYSSLLAKLSGANPRNVPGLGFVQAINVKILAPQR